MTEEDFQKSVSTQVEEIWNRVFESSNRVLLQHLKYGFDGYKSVPRPNVHDMLIQLQVFNAAFDVLLRADLGYDNNRQLLNAKAQVTNMERLAFALDAGNQQDYEAAVAALDRQAVV